MYILYGVTAERSAFRARVKRPWMQATNRKHRTMKDQPSDYLYVILLGILLLLVGGLFLMNAVKVSDEFSDVACKWMAHIFLLVLFVGAPIWAIMSYDEKNRKK